MQGNQVVEVVAEWVCIHSRDEILKFSSKHSQLLLCVGVHWENYISISFHSEWDMIVVTVFEPNWNSIWFKNCHHDYIPFTVKGNGNIVFSVYMIFTPVFYANMGKKFATNMHWLLILMHKIEMVAFLCQNQLTTLSTAMSAATCIDGKWTPGVPVLNLICT